MKPTKTMRTLAALAGLALGLGCANGYVVPRVSSARPSVTISADAAVAAGELDHAWEMMAGSGNASLYIREVWSDRMLEHLADVHDNLGVQTVRFHGIFLDEVGVYQGPGEYSFANVDRIYDAILDAGVRPFVELSFMPRELASCNQRGFPGGYKPYICPPKDYDEWGRMIEAFTRHLVQRYGLDEVRAWHFEVWNEPNLSVFWGGSKEDYFRLYEVTVRAIKSVDAKLPVGGPATSAAVDPWIYDLIDFCRQRDLPLDFIATHGYSNESLAAVKKDARQAGASIKLQRGQGFYHGEVRLIRALLEAAGMGDLPVFLTEWNSSVAYSYTINQWPNDHDLPNDAAFMCEAARQANGYTQGFAHWTYSDVFEEWGLPGEGMTIKSGAFHGGFGLINYNGIHKPAYHAFAFLHRMGRRLLEARVQNRGAKGVNAMITHDGDTLSVLAWNYVDTIKTRRRAGPTAQLSIELQNLSPTLRGKVLKGYRIDWDHGNPFAGWLELKKPAELSPDQVEELKARSDDTLRDADLDVTIDAGALILTFDLPPGGVAFLTTE